MKKMILILLLTFCFAVYVHAFDPCCAQKRFALQGELLYFKGSTDNTAFIAQIPSILTPTSNTYENRIANNPDWKPGFRVEGDWLFCDCINSFQVRYTNHYSGQNANASGVLTSAVSPSTILTAGGVPGVASSRITINYQSGDIAWQHFLYDDCDADFSFLLGLHVVGTKYKENTFVGLITLETATKSWKSRFFGIGPEIGLQAHYTLPWIRNLSLAGDVRGALLAGKTQSRFTDSSTGNATITYINQPKCWNARPVFDGRLGLRYMWSCFCLYPIIEIGYELIWYSNILDKISYSDSTAITTIDFYSDLSLHGPYAAFRISF